MTKTSEPKAHNFKDQSGLRFGRLLAIEVAGKNKHGKWEWLCKCDCGEESVVLSSNLASGNTQSCGCLDLEAKTIHGMSGTPEFAAWAGMKCRCEDPSHAQWDRYGGRGIAVCKRWRESFENFFSDVGPRPSLKHSIDRIDNDGDYEPRNVKWSTRREQQNNMRTNRHITYQGHTMTIAQWARKLGMKEGTLRDRLNRGWPVSRALTEPGGSHE